MLIYLAVIGDYLANQFRRVYNYISHTTFTQNPKPILKCTCNQTKYLCNRSPNNIPVWLAAIVLVIYISGGALIFNFIEKWTFLDSWYFCFLSLVTIGFGGFTPGRMESISMIATSAYILVGMALLSMCFNLIQADVIMFFRNLYIWSEREDSSNLLSLSQMTTSWHQNIFGINTEVSSIQNNKQSLNRHNKLHNSLPRSFIKTPDGTFQRQVPARKSFESAQNHTYLPKTEIYLAEIPPLPESVLNRSKIGKRKLDRVSSSRVNIDDTFIWRIIKKYVGWQCDKLVTYLQ